MSSRKKKVVATQEVMHPEIEVQLVGKPGDAETILEICDEAMEEAELNESERKKFREEATGGTYDDLLATCLRWFTVC